MIGESVYETPTTAPEQVSDPVCAVVEKARALFCGVEADASGADAEPAQSEEREASPCQRLTAAFGLSAFELDIVLLCAAVEADPESREMVAACHRDATGPYPTFQLALDHLREPRWDALLPHGPLRRWKLIEVWDGTLLLTARLSIAEPVLHFLMGRQCLDERLSGMLTRVEQPRALPSCYQSATLRLAALLAREPAAGACAQLCGSATRGKRSVAAAACAAVGLRLFEIPPAQATTVLAGQTLALLERDAALNGFALLLHVDDGKPADWASASQFVDSFAGPVIVTGDAVLEPRRRSVERIAVERPAPADQLALWDFALGGDAVVPAAQLERVASQFSLDCETILRGGDAVRERVRDGELSEAAAGDLLMEFCRADSRSALRSLAQAIEAKAGWNDIVLPESSLEVLRAIAAQVRQQGRVLDSWGFAQQTTRGLGISALFHGLSGTGKTLAAEVLARDLKLDLFRIDLSQMVSKYIGETEKNLRTLFDAAENTGAILLFDEADALFGKRSEVRDSHDRYANIEVSYLLQRVESYRGLAILTTNMRAALDAAFLRRISFFVNFPFPDQQQRRGIWQRMFPPQTPCEGLDFDKLSRLNLPGGNIRNIALNAAYIAADRQEPVRMEHLLIASRRECAKIERPLTAAETGAWV